MVRCSCIGTLVLTLSCVAPLPIITPTAISSTANATCRHAGACTQCPRCQSCCELEVKKVDEAKHCWEVETKEICVPRVVFPWQNRSSRQKQSHQAGCGCQNGCTGSCACEDGACGGRGCARCTHNGAWVKTVRVLKKHGYTCPTCDYSWSPRKSTCSGGTCSNGNCSCSDSIPQLTPISEALPAKLSDELAEPVTAPDAPMSPSPIDDVRFSE